MPPPDATLDFLVLHLLCTKIQFYIIYVILFGKANTLFIWVSFVLNKDLESPALGNKYIILQSIVSAFRIYYILKTITPCCQKSHFFCKGGHKAKRVV